MEPRQIPLEPFAIFFLREKHIIMNHSYKTSPDFADNDASNKHPGLLPTSSVDANGASQDPKGSSNFAAGVDVYSSMLAGHVSFMKPLNIFFITCQNLPSYALARQTCIEICLSNKDSTARQGILRRVEPRTSESCCQRRGSQR